MKMDPPTKMIKILSEDPAEEKKMDQHTMFSTYASKITNASKDR